ncbi:hypothetical protein BH24BAC1_BH24BAC1_16060 [soil metagenome]
MEAKTDYQVGNIGAGFAGLVAEWKETRAVCRNGLGLRLPKLVYERNRQKHHPLSPANCHFPERNAKIRPGGLPSRAAGGNFCPYNSS